MKGRDMGFRCSMGFHAGEWTYTSYGSCDQERICERSDCRKVSHRVDHEALGPWSLDNPRDHTICEGSAECRRCGDSISSVEHEYDWGYTSDDYCDQARICIRCEERDDSSSETRVQHSWGDWHSDQSGDKTRLCRRCGDEQTR